MSDDRREEEFARFEEERKHRADKLAEELRALALTNHEKAQLVAELQGVINLLSSLAAYKPEKRIYEQSKQKLTEALNHSDLQTSTSPVLGGNGPAVSSPDVTPPTPSTVIKTPEQHLAALKALDEKLSKLIEDERVPASLKEVFRTLQEDVKRSIPVVVKQIEDASVESEASVIPTSRLSTTSSSSSPLFRRRDGGLEEEFDEASSTKEDFERTLDVQREIQHQAVRAEAAEREVIALREELRASREAMEEQRRAMEEMERELEEHLATVTNQAEELASVRAESEQRQEQFSAATARADHLQAQLYTSQADVAARIEVAREEAKQEAQVEAQERIIALESKLGSFQSRPELKQDDLQAEITKLRGLLDENVKLLASQNSVFQRQVDNAQRKARAAEASAAALQKQLDRLKQERPEASIEQKKAWKKNTYSADLSRKIKETQDLVQVTVQRVRALNERLASLTSEQSKQNPTDSEQPSNDSSPAPGGGSR